MVTDSRPQARRFHHSGETWRGDEDDKEMFTEITRHRQAGMDCEQRRARGRSSGSGGSLLVTLCLVVAWWSSVTAEQDLAKDLRQGVIHGETNLLQLRDDVLPPERQRCVWSSGNDGKHRVRHSHGRRGRRRHHKQTEGHDEETRAVSSRSRRSPALLNYASPSSKVHFYTQNAYPQPISVDLSMLNSRNNARATINDMFFGDWRVADLPLHLEDTLIVSSQYERYSQTIKNKIRKVPDRAESFIVVDQTTGGNLHASLTIYDMDIPVHRRTAWLMTYNALLHPEDGNKVFHGVDVIIFDASKYKVDYSLHRIARNITLHMGQESLAPEGDYELKVIPHGQAADVDQFKNAKSLLKPIYITLKGGERHYVTVQGILDSKQYPPRLESVPPIQTAAPQRLPKTPLIALNAFGGPEETKIMFPHHNVTIRVPSGQGVAQLLPLKRGDIFNVTTNDGERHGFIIHTEVPYRDGECALIPDRSRTGQLEAFFGCWYRLEAPLPRSKFWIFAYHAMLGYDQPVDWIVYDESALNDPNRHALFSLADNLYLTHGIASRTDIGNYTLKVVPHGSVYDPESFKNAESLIEPAYINPQPSTRYYAAIQGNLAQGKGVFTSYPPMPAAPPAPLGEPGTSRSGADRPVRFHTALALLLMLLQMTWLL